MPDAFSCMEKLIGNTGTEKLSRAKIAVFGLGGAGSYTAEALARCGVASLTLVEHGTVSVSNISRELYALRSTVGKSKVQVAKSRIRDIDEGILVNTYETFYNEETAQMFDLSTYDYIVDTMDSLPSKVLLIEKARASKTPVISCMGTENKIDPFGFEIADISKAGSCPLIKAMKQELCRRGIHKVKVLYSKEKPFGTTPEQENGSISFVSGAAGFLLAGAVIRELLEADVKRELKGISKSRKNKTGHILRELAKQHKKNDKLFDYEQVAKRIENIRLTSRKK